ncbi:7401_t:CDS:2 [Cetraspora pellucida]|uniref:7401_t:CDS:1 n=1 Tax=Cetraspora pellucida TaxID=1433469 RepID=A0ACA9MER5_9GLOM|nr:7401_t:CDS:2 [Cetraspora pellucida]
MDNVIDLKKELYIALQDSSEIVSYNAKLQDRYEKQEKKINREREQWDRDRKKWGKKLGGANTEIQKLHTHDLELIDEARPGPEALPLPAVASTLMSPLSAYIFLILLIIAVMWFVRRTWGLERKSDRFWDM